MEQELSKKEIKQLRRQEKRDGQAKGRRMKKTKKLIVWAVLVAAIVIAGFFAIQAITPESFDTDYSQAMVEEGVSHVADGVSVQYQSNPPTSGNHWSNPLRDGIYDTEKPDEAIIHSLEHGRVWVSYQPNISEEVIQALEQELKGEFGVILTPRSQNETNIALAAWTRLDTFNLPEDGTLDTKRILDFILRYRNKGPEYVPQNTGSTYE